MQGDEGQFEEWERLYGHGAVEGAAAGLAEARAPGEYVFAENNPFLGDPEALQKGKDLFRWEARMAGVRPVGHAGTGTRLGSGWGWSRAVGLLRSLSCALYRYCFSWHARCLSHSRQMCPGTLVWGLGYLNEAEVVGVHVCNFFPIVQTRRAKRSGSGAGGRGAGQGRAGS